MRRRSQATKTTSEEKPCNTSEANKRHSISHRFNFYDAQLESFLHEPPLKVWACGVSGKALSRYGGRAALGPLRAASTTTNSPVGLALMSAHR